MALVPGLLAVSAFVRRFAYMWVVVKIMRVPFLVP